ncbi:pyrroloquinoline quinone biosynthesis peptide chaperone PqqD [Roseomonas nepalensis]|uniref:Pyrroloquinoline quinone biosynthesis peptide chaperone PqqD n=1 Tax=Muricoccus nepalensis TaxID=1854500 RepID=A0A502GIK7_9PROT|nr:pyrroloquinoline quinone biosynthesis peptide chaperone PqqD [Roseomonas nepalensis]TPG61130.1 pyrroloquinoline quinone biosynthesis peptide chaperone PqqD [Roseomonas nepalensis]
MTVEGATVLRLARGMRLREDTARGRWVVMGPERLFVPDEIALEILRLLDGARSVDAIVDSLAARYDAPRDAIGNDVTALLQDLAGRGVVAA